MVKMQASWIGPHLLEVTTYKADLSQETQNHRMRWIAVVRLTQVVQPQLQVPALRNQ